MHYPIFLAGERCCSPETFEGVTEYQDALKVLSDPVHPGHSAILERMDDFNPENFDSSKVLFWDARGRLDMALAEMF